MTDATVVYNPFLTPTGSAYAESDAFTIESDDYSEDSGRWTRLSVSTTFSHFQREELYHDRARSTVIRPFKSRRLVGKIGKTWLDRPQCRNDLLARWIPICGAFFGLMICIAYGYSGWTAYETNKFCLVLEDNFDFFNEDVWTREVELGGFGNGEFEWTTPYENNSYVKDGKLHIAPTLTTLPPGENTVLNLTAMGICTSDPLSSGRSLQSSCVARKNVTAGTIIPPVQSARLNTLMSTTIRYGKVEVRAKLPTGDWLWPAIWMMPVNNTYGPWPASGEIDIVESRGNGPEYTEVNFEKKRISGGRNTITSTLHWGPHLPFNVDSYWQTTDGLKFPNGYTSLTNTFHTFGLEWTPTSVNTYVDNQLTRVARFKFPKSGFWLWGKFPTNFVNPWLSASLAAPFDQAFYLIINLGIGGTNGYFSDQQGHRPWSLGGGRDLAMKQFMDAKDKWLPTWGPNDDSNFIIDSVKIYSLC